jgi:hypothetical protein
MFFTDEELTKKPKAAAGIDPSSLKRLSYEVPLRPLCSDPMSLPFGSLVALDAEIYHNYSLLCFKHFETGQYFYMEAPFNVSALQWALSHFTLVTFNGNGYDMIIISHILKGADSARLKSISDKIIKPDDIDPDDEEAPIPRRIETPFNHIDLIEVAPLRGSLKLYGGRMHVPRLQELPIPPSAILTPNECLQVRDYCFNDCDVTHALYTELEPHIRLREKLGAKIGVDFRSKSDAQLAEELFRQELKRVTGQWPKKPGPESAVGRVFTYTAPDYARFRSNALGDALGAIQATPLTVGMKGHIDKKNDIEGRVLAVNGKPYKIGLGGLHSQEKCQAIVASSEMLIIDRDVTGYYPSLIINNKYAPAHLGDTILTLLQESVDGRTAAKLLMQQMSPTDKGYDDIAAEADGGKIKNNGYFGKTSDPWSIFYEPEKMLHTTLTGQISILMLIESLEDIGVKVVSANTDGIVFTCHHSRYDEVLAVFDKWEALTGLKTEETRYKALYSANVNNYIAVTMDGKTKAKGWYTEKGSALNSRLSKNPQSLICSDAVKALLSVGTPIEDTIRKCSDITRFVTVRNVKGGAHKDGYYLGKVVRWYYATDTKGVIRYILTGNKVPDTEGAVPLMQLPPQLPEDLDYGWYIAKANSILEDIGYSKVRSLI